MSTNPQLIIAGVVPGVSLLLLALILCWVFCCRARRQQTTLHPAVEASQRPGGDIEKGIITTRHASAARANSYPLGSKSSLKFHQLHHDAIAIPPVDEPEEEIGGTCFSWAQRPELIAEATDNGWSRFAFHDTLYRSGSGSNWEAPPGSSELMQAVRLNPADSKPTTNNDHHSNLLSDVRMRLPLPGPVLAGLPFPQEAYFEVSIIYLKPHDEHRQKWYVRASKRGKDVPVEGDRSRLLDTGSSRVADAIKAIREQVKGEEGEEKGGKEKGRKNRHAVISVGLSAGVRMAKPGLAGMYPGSIGFHSDGSVYLDGTKLAIESEKKTWADAERVIGCGFDPSKQKVFFTLDSRIVHSIRCSSPTYASPLFPVLASNTDTVLLVNLGQAKFQFRPANAKRTPNPCFLMRPNNNNNEEDSDVPSAGFGYDYEDDDSVDLFSVGRADSCWSRVDSIKKSGPLFSDGVVATPSDFDHDDSDFFEIPLKDC